VTGRPEVVQATRPIAYIYDRLMTVNDVMLKLRLDACAEYVTEQGWGWGGWWIDKGDCALTGDQRPAFDALVRTVQEAPAGRPRVCLIHDWSRLSHSHDERRAFARRILLAGGWMETITGETVQRGDPPDGRLSNAPQVIA
jgi:hypothetical protein